MKTLIIILCFSVVCCYHSKAQTTSAKKNAQVTEPVEQQGTPVRASTTATLVSGSRNPVVQEIPIENNTETTEPKTQIISSEKKPK